MNAGLLCNTKRPPSGDVSERFGEVRSSYLLQEMDGMLRIYEVEPRLKTNPLRSLVLR